MTVEQLNHLWNVARSDPKRPHDLRMRQSPPELWCMTLSYRYTLKHDGTDVVLVRSDRRSGDGAVILNRGIDAIQEFTYWSGWELPTRMDEMEFLLEDPDDPSPVPYVL